MLFAGVCFTQIVSVHFYFMIYYMLKLVRVKIISPVTQAQALRITNMPPLSEVLAVSCIFFTVHTSTPHSMRDHSSKFTKLFKALKYLKQFKYLHIE